MTIIEKMTFFISKKANDLLLFKSNKFKFGAINFKPLIIFLTVSLLFVVFFVSINTLDKKVIQDKNNLDDLTSTSEFTNFSKYLLSKLNSPYEEHNYTIKNNDTIEKILKKFEIKSKDIKSISAKLKKKQLSNIYSGREMSLVLKKSNDGVNSVINLLFPISNTISIEVRKTQDDFIVKEKLLLIRRSER